MHNTWLSCSREVAIISRVVCYINCQFVHAAIGNAQFTVTVVSSPLGDGSNGFPVSSALNLTCMIMPTPSSTATYEWMENCNAIPKCFPTGQTTKTVGTSRLKAEDSGSYRCLATINGVSVLSINELIVRVTGKAQIMYAYNYICISNYHIICIIA